MTKNEFVDILRRNISSVNDYEYVNETVQYYMGYIESEIRKGKTEEEVLNELGDPRLIAKSIKNSRAVGSDDEYAESTDTVEEEKNKKIHINTASGKSLQLPLWLFKTGLIVAGIGIIALFIFIIVWAVRLFLPVALVIVLILLVRRFIRDNF